MTDVFISHAREDRAACERLADALTCIGLSVAWSTEGASASDLVPEPDKQAPSALATVVLWSRRALSCDWVRPEALRAFGTKPDAPSALLNRYAGLIVDDIEAQELPVPFDATEIVAWPDWFQASEIDFDDRRFTGLLSTLEGLTGRTKLIDTARAIATRDQEARRLRDALASRGKTKRRETEGDTAAKSDAVSNSDELAQVRRNAEELSQKLNALEKERSDLLDSSNALAAELSARSATAASLDALVAELKSQNASLLSERERLSSHTSDLEMRLAESRQSAKAVHDELEQKNIQLRALQSDKDALIRDVEDARSGLAGALRQQKTFQAQIDASDQVIREVMTQREELIAKRDRLERDSEKIATQLGDTARRLAESENTRKTYEAALVERAREIHVLEDKVASVSSELDTLKPRAVALSEAVKTWDHVPWRSIAAGGIAAGALVTYGATLGGQALDAWLTKPRPVASPMQVAEPGPQIDATLPPKSEVKAAPDTLQVVDRGVPQGLEAPPDEGAVPGPEDPNAPISNDQVQFNPEGLPPVDADSRPPPQDLPPMQQKPKLLLKPPAPP